MCTIFSGHIIGILPKTQQHQQRKNSFFVIFIHVCMQFHHFIPNKRKIIAKPWLIFPTIAFFLCFNKLSKCTFAQTGRTAIKKMSLMENVCSPIIYIFFNRNSTACSNKKGKIRGENEMMHKKLDLFSNSTSFKYSSFFKTKFRYVV